MEKDAGIVFQKSSPLKIVTTIIRRWFMYHQCGDMDKMRLHEFDITRN